MIASRNPFRTERVLSIRYRLPGSGLDGLMDRFETTGRRGALVGPQGSGKTTLLEDLAPVIQSRGYQTRWINLDEESGFFDAAQYRPFFAALDSGTIVLLDSAEKLGRWRWWTFARESRRAAGLLITTHGAGFLPTLRECRTTPGLLNDLVRDLVGPEADTLPLAPLYDRHRGNLREVLRALYDLYAGRATISG
jgi:energy-coupling factor transporter ATP-binding protein EcfA2